MKTRQQYLAGEISHHDYYSQFITDEMIEQVKQNIGIERLMASTDEHLNDIPLKEWDALSGTVFMRERLIDKPKISHEFHEKTKEAKEAGEGISPSTLVCVYKAIARNLINKK